MKNEFRNLIIKLLTNTVGRLLVFVRPIKATELSEKGMTLIMNNNLSITERLMRNFIMQRIKIKKILRVYLNFIKIIGSTKGEIFS